MDNINPSSHPIYTGPVVSSQPGLTKSLSTLSEVFKNTIKSQQRCEAELAKIKEQIQDLTNEMGRYETSLTKVNAQQQDLRQEIEKLEGGKAAKVLIIGSLVKLFYRLYNRQILSKNYTQHAELQKAQQDHEEQLKLLRGKLQSQQIMLAQEESDSVATSAAIGEAIEKLPQVSSISPEELPQIFEVESQIGEILNLLHFPEKKRYQELYNQKILPLVNLAKQYITQRPFHFAVQAAAEKGKAAQAGLMALKTLAENQPVLQPSGVSAQEVFLLPKHGTVFKRAHEKAKEEERNTNELFHLMSKQAVVGTFDIQKASVEKFGIQISEKIQERGFTPKTLSPQPDLMHAIKSKLSRKDQLVLENYEKTPSRKDANAVNYEERTKEEYYLKLPDQDWQKVSFQELQRRFLADQLPPEAQIGLNQGQAISLKENILGGTPLAQALNYLPSLKASPHDLYLTPDLSDEYDKKAYEHCEQFKWSYRDALGFTHEADFKTVHALYLQGKIRPPSIKPILSSASQSPPKILNAIRPLTFNGKP
jgi:hypothetical protein